LQAGRARKAGCRGAGEARRTGTSNIDPCIVYPEPCRSLLTKTTRESILDATDRLLGRLGTRDHHRRPRAQAGVARHGLPPLRARRRSSSARSTSSTGCSRACGPRASGAPGHCATCSSSACSTASTASATTQPRRAPLVLRPATSAAAAGTSGPRRILAGVLAEDPPEISKPPTSRAPRARSSRTR
jgi:hypothetical protein